MSVLVYSQNIKQSEMRFRAAKSMHFMQKVFGVSMVFFVVVLYFIWLLTGDIVKPITSSPVTINDSTFVCNEKLDDNRKYFYSSYSTPTTPSPLPTIYFVTPTYPRREQIAELTRLGQTLMHIPNLHWIVADDYDGCNTFLDFTLNRFGIPYTHIASPMPDIYRSYAPIPRGVANRRAAINWIRNSGKKTGVLYFGDDDNAFDLRLFSEIRSTQRVSMFPVGLIGLYAVSTPIVKQGKVIGFFDSWPANRLWPVDMAGFAVNLEYLALSPNATMPYPCRLRGG
ncbi:hypothetical protein HA402_005188 [Bradysia odoriphaga]|nr:hypothetical protein HA402_005188 [Bradysia odoriphaga]